MTADDVPQLVQIGRRLRALVHDPRSTKRLWTDLTAPVLRWMDWQPEIQSTAAAKLVDHMHAGKVTVEQLAAAIGELSDNLTQLERCVAVHDALPPAYVGWIWRVHRALARTDALLKAGQPTPWSAQAGTEAQRVRLLPPMKLASGSEPGPPCASQVDALLEAASDEGSLLERRRHLLEAAREVLLDTATLPTVDPDQIAARYGYVARELTQLDRLQAAGVRPDVALDYQLKEALRRGDTGRAHATVMALDEAAARRGDVDLLVRTRRVLEAMWQGHAPQGFALDSLARSGEQILGPQFAETVRSATCDARERLKQTPVGALSFADKLDLQRQQRQLGDGAEDRLLRVALGVAGRFELGGRGAPYRTVVEEHRVRSVSFPTQKLRVEPARGVEDVAQALIQDPRSVLHDLASGRLLARRFEASEVQRVKRDGLRTEVRVYVLDGSGSMLGVRAQMRDAILLTELATLLERFGDPDRRLNTVLFYRYFNKELGPARRISSAADVMQAIADVVGTPRFGGTNIEAALLSCFEQIRAARSQDADLHRAQIVLITDGDAPVDLDKLRAAREAVGELRIGVSVVALGEENQALREMTRVQRTLGEQVFYHFLPDAELHAIDSGHVAGSLPVHLPADLALDTVAPELAELAEDVHALQRQRDFEAMEGLEDHQQALQEVGLDPAAILDEAEQARIETLRGDRDALARRVERWFPGASSTTEPAAPGRVSADTDDLEALHATLLGVAHVTELLRGGSELRHQADAIEILQRMLLDAGVGPWRYDELLRTHPARLQPAIDAVREALGCD